MFILKLIILFVVANVFVAVVFTMDDIKEIKDIEKDYNNNFIHSFTLYIIAYCHLSIKFDFYLLLISLLLQTRDIYVYMRNYL